MDELYDNLDNYEDLHIAEQLKTENAELKKKLEEYSLAMDKLQKDFDRVSSDFKKLEMNYSSLLKTARVEIERKTKIIKDLTVEKDMMVLKALQNGNTRDYRNLRRTQNTFQKGPTNDNSSGRKSTNSSTDNLNVKCDIGRKEDNRLSSVDTVASSNTDISGRLLKLATLNVESTELSSDRTSDTKENMAKKDEESTSSTKTLPLSIRNRRKSMPAARSQAKFSSDEEEEDTYCRNEIYKNCFPTREANTRQTERVNDRYRHKDLEERNKVSESSSVDDRHSGYEPNRDPYHRGRNDKYEMERFRAKDRYDNPRHRRRTQMSPDRFRWRSRPEHHRQEYGRHKYLESPPPDKFHNYQQRNRENRSIHDKDKKGHTADFEKRDRQQDKNPPKHKISNDHIEEPSSKRPRTDSLNKYAEEEKLWVKEKGVQLEKTVSDLFEEMPRYTSCQSPDDYLLSDDSCHPVKEIMNTASVPLEDPRTHSKRYVLTKVDSNPALSTITGRNVDLKMVDLSKWGLNEVNVPKALTRRPSQSSDALIKEIYLDIDNPITNMSTESGEILSCTEDEPVKNDFDKTGKPMQGGNLKSLYTDRCALAPKVDHTKDILLKSTYRIPKIKNTSNQDMPLPRNMASKTDYNKKDLKTAEHSFDDINKDHKPMIHKTDNEHKPECKNDKFSENLNKHKHKNKESLAAVKAIIAGDLELSDETSDNIEMPGKTTSEYTTNKNIINKVENKSTPLNTIEDKKPDCTNLERNVPVQQTEIEKGVESIPVDNKKQKCRKKTLKSRDTNKTDKNEYVTDRREKLKKDKKSKFSELFGDSNSLITPEDIGCNSLISPDDLGITDVSTQPQTSTNYIPICEDAQDAVDVNVSEAVKIKTQSAQSTEAKGLEKTVSDNIPNIADSISNPQTKTIHETNVKKSRNNESDNLGPVDPQPSQACDELIKVLSTEIPVTIPLKKAQLPSMIEMPNIGVTPQEEVDQFQIPKNLLHKPDALLNALATSTPQKLPQLEDPDIDPSSAAVEPLKELSGNAAGADSTLEKQEADMPDVRIFVKRRRRVIKKTS